MTQIAFNQRNIGRFNRNIAAGANGKTHIRKRQSRRVINAVADHGNFFPLRLPLSDAISFFFG